MLFQLNRKIEMSWNIGSESNLEIKISPKNLDLLQDRYCFCSSEPHLEKIHHLDVTVNWYTKKPKNIAKRSLTNGIFQQLHDGTFLEEIHVKLQLTTLKPLHTQQLTELYNHIATNEGKADVMLLGSEKPLMRN